MALFDRFISKREDEKEGKSFFPTHYTKAFSRLNTASEEAKAQYPDDSVIVEDFLWALKEFCRTRYQKALNDPQPLKAAPQFFLSKDRMCAYACLLPPENDGDEISLEEFLEDAYYEGIQYGVLEESIPQDFAAGYYHMFPIARGKPPRAGEDGKVIELFQRRKNMHLEVQNGSEVDFSQDIPLQPIRKGSAICLIRLPKEGTDGMDVTGQTVPSPPVSGTFVPQGENTAIERGGRVLTASVDGILYIENDRFCIHEQKIIEGGLVQFQGTLQISGNLYIGGDVDGGVSIEASGDIVIGGKVGQARITSTAGTIRVQRGIMGTRGKTFLAAACQVQSPVVEQASIEAGTSVIAEVILSSDIQCGGTVYVMSGRGMIVDSRIRTKDSILCLRIGNLAEGRNVFSVGYPPEVSESWKRLKAELNKMQASLDQLWTHITSLQRKSFRISPEEASLLERLTEQRDLYAEQRDALSEELKQVNTVLNKRTRGRIRCEQLYPILEIQIGRLTKEIITREEKCNIHVEENHIVLKEGAGRPNVRSR